MRICLDWESCHNRRKVSVLNFDCKKCLSQWMCADKVLNAAHCPPASRKVCKASNLPCSTRTQKTRQVTHTMGIRVKPRRPSPAPAHQKKLHPRESCSARDSHGLPTFDLLHPQQPKRVSLPKHPKQRQWVARGSWHLREMSWPGWEAMDRGSLYWGRLLQACFGLCPAHYCSISECFPLHAQQLFVWLAPLACCIYEIPLNQMEA